MRKKKKCLFPREKEEEFKQRIVEMQLRRKAGRVTAKDVQELLKKEFAVEYALKTVYKVLKRAGLFWLSARSQHPRANQEEQVNFKKKFSQKMEEILPQGKAHCPFEIWFPDEAKIGQRGTVTRMWAPKGTRPQALRQQQFKYAYLFGAVCPLKDKAVALVMPKAIKESMEKHLEAISSAVEEGDHAIVILDRAAWHTSKKLTHFDNLILLPLPPASPELTPPPKNKYGMSSDRNILPIAAMPTMRISS